MKHLLPLILCLSLASFCFAQNNGILFDGTSEKLEIPHKPEFNAQGAFTLEAWIYANAWQGQVWQGSIINKDKQGPDEGFAFRAGDNGKLSFVAAANNAWNEVSTGSIMNTQQWHHVALVINAGTMTLFIDGQSVATAPYSGTLSGSTMPLNIGASPGFGDRFFDGIIDEVRIWNVARTQTEIANNLTTEFTGTEPGLVAYFPMNDGSGSVATNLVDAACSATLINMDDSNWVDGYSIPDYDVAVQSVTNLDVVNVKTRPILISAVLQNLGNESIGNIDLTVNVDGNDIFTETYSGSIPSGEKFTYDFITPLDLTMLSNPTITVTTSQAQDQNSLNNSKSASLNIQPGNLIRLFDAQAHNFGAAGQKHLASVVFPDLSSYDRLLMHIDLDCPSGGCDPWDQPANVSLITPEGTYEIARYITPYGIACGPWTVDVTDFKSIINGAVEFESFIQVWGGSGWLATIDLELVSGANPYPYSQLNPLWATNYWVYGDPGINDDLDPVDVTVENITEASHVRMTITGHGQGNTNNAAEFYNVTHQFQVNGATINNHNLWKADCAENTCADQAGSWLFARAGWCPGQEVIPYVVNTTADAPAGSSVSMDYALQDYTNLLNTGYNNNGHTEPHYRIWAYFVEESTQRYTDYLNLVCDAISPTVSGSGTSQSLDDLSITITNNGNQPLSDFEVGYFINNTLIATETVTGPLAPNGSMTHTFTTLSGFTAGADNTFYGVVAHPQDQDHGDNVSAFFSEGSVSNQEVAVPEGDIRIFPNPNSGQSILEVEGYLLGANLEIIHANGQVVRSQDLRDERTAISLEENGVFLLRITHPEGYSAYRKVVVLR